ncbi:hypothetical protein ACO0QE_002273 [Hanseniaspora vineae]
MSTVEQVQEPVANPVEQTEQASVVKTVDEKSTTPENTASNEAVEEDAEPAKAFVPAPVPVASPWKVVDANAGVKKGLSVAEAVEELKNSSENKTRNNQLLRSSSKDRWVPLHANITVSTKLPNSSPRQGSGKPKSHGNSSGPQRGANKKKRTTNKRKQAAESETNGEASVSESNTELPAAEDSKSSAASSSSKKSAHGNGVSKKTSNKAKSTKKNHEVSVNAEESSQTTENPTTEENTAPVSETEGSENSERKPFNKRSNGYTYNSNNGSRPFNRNGNGPRRHTQPRHHHHHNNNSDGSSRPRYSNNNTNGYRRHHNNYGYGQFPPQQFANGAEFQGHPRSHRAPSPYFAAQKVAKQLQYYFGEQNLTKDAYLKNQISSKNGFIPLSLISKFYRVVNLSYGGDPNIVLGALYEIVSNSTAESSIEVAILKENLENDDVLSKYVIRSSNWDQFLGEESQEIDYDLEKTAEATDLDSFKIEAPVYDNIVEGSVENNAVAPQADHQPAEVIEQSA